MPPKYKNVIGDHITLEYDIQKDIPLPSTNKAIVFAIADDNIGLQVLILKIKNSIYRPDGKIFHITWSKEPGRKSSESQNVIDNNIWNFINEEIIDIHPKIMETPN